MDRVLTADEREQLTESLRPAVEEGKGEWRMAFAHVSGVRR
jgi:hypothetical protein